MIDNIRLSEKAKQQLIVIKRKTSIENWNVLCRWALCLSLAEESIPPFEDIQTDSSVEMTWKIFAGDNSEILKSIIKQSFSHQLAIDDLNIYFKLHLHRGISFLNSNVNNVESIYDMVI
ncbi:MULTISPECIES: DNA sulfur modification protein DndE [Aeromonas]|uniref:DNA sulfur modification protein DndE n=1 Tax=Aeromonas TaxID=642 RepID=UPI001C24AF92|nr:MULTISPECIES: DNA sulfur modification protein DndE [Aeromonas]QWZ82205.1 DNA sulfur modification protein DndE [Aeromonas sp. FDAARGOS 1414]